VGVTVQGKTQAGQGGALDLGSLDTALAGAGAGKGGKGAAPRGGGGTSASGGGGAAEGAGGQGGFSISWDKPAAGRERKLLAAPKPKLPAWVGTQGLTLRVVVSFSVSPEGVVSQPRLEKSSGFSDVDASVVEAVRLWRFSADQSAPLIRGRVPYEIRTR
jgi:TonB family protein